MRVLTEAGKEKGAGDTEILPDKSIGKMMSATASIGEREQTSARGETGYTLRRLIRRI